MSDLDSPVGLTVHSLRAPALDDDLARRTRSGRFKMLLVLAICAAPVVASYLAYYVLRPTGRTNYSELIEPQRPIPPQLVAADLAGHPVAAAALRGHWSLVVVSSGACDRTCERLLWLQRQVREALGRDKDRVAKVWLIDDAAPARPAVLEGVTVNTDATVWRVSAAALAAWLRPAPGRALEDHLYIVDPMGNWMMRAPPDPDPAKLKRDIDKLLRASAGWNQPNA